jgi:hypothetical protein
VNALHIYLQSERDATSISMHVDMSRTSLFGLPLPLLGNLRMAIWFFAAQDCECHTCTSAYV